MTRTLAAPGLKVRIPYVTLIRAVRQMPRRAREAFLEDLLALTSSDYLESIREARADCRAGRVKSHAAVFGKSR